MANGKIDIGKKRLLSSTALTKHVAVFGALGLVFGASSASALDPNALPTDPNVVGGAATFNQSGATLNVNQSSSRTVIDWRSFDIGSNATTNFIQPGASAIAVNRVNSSANPTQIQGSLNANGQVWILNPNGVMFGKTAKVDVAGIVASTGNIDAAAFMRGDNRLQFTGVDGGEVSNAGLISVADGGLAAFVAPSVRNSGVIRARVGKVTLAAGTTYTLDLAGDRLVELGLGADNALVDQSGQVLADGSVVTITAKAASAVVDSIVNVSGTVMASGVHEAGGKIILTAGNVTTTGDAVLAADGGTNGDGGTIYGYADNVGTYDGTFSAKGGANSGDGGSIETSGKQVDIQSGLRVNASAANGATGSWTIDPDDLTVDGGNVGTYETNLGTANVNLLADNSITLDTDFNTSGQANSNTLNFQDEGVDNKLTINLNGKITLAGSQSLTGDGTIVNVSSAGSIQNGVDVAATGADIGVAAGSYAANTTVNKDDLTLTGADGAKINVGVNDKGVIVNANNVTLTGFEIAGPVVGDQVALDWGTAGNSWGVFVQSKSNSNVNIHGNNIHDVRTGILIANSGANGTQDTTLTDAASGTIADNVIENTKGAILVQYRDGHTFDIHGNSEGPNGNEWGIVTGLQNTKLASDPTLARQQQILDWANTNSGMTVLDRQYATGNRSEVTVDATGTATAADDFGLGNGVGNERQPINNINEGIKAVVAGGTVNVNDGTYVIPLGGANYISIGKSLNLLGESEAGTIIDAHGASSYGIRVIGGTDGVTLSNFTLYGVTAAGGYGIKVEDSQNVNIDHVTSQGAYKAQFDLNGLRTGSLDYVTADGSAGPNGGGSVKGAAIAITDSQNITVTNSSTNDGSYGGLAIYQSNKPTGYVYQVDNIDIAASNTFAEANPVYMEDESATNDFGAVTVAGFDYAVGNNGDPADVYTFFQKTRQNAIDYATAVSAATAFVQGWTGSTVDNIFTVGYNTAETLALSINAAIQRADTGATINVDGGSFALGTGQLNINKGLTLKGAGEGVTNISSTSAGYGISVSGNDVTLSGFTFNASGIVNNSAYGIKVSPGGVATNRLTGFAIDNVTVDGSYKTGLDLNGVDGATIDNVTVTGSAWGNGLALTDSANIHISNVTTSGNEWGGLAIYQANRSYDQQVNNITIDGVNSFGEANPVYIEDESDGSTLYGGPTGLDIGTVTIAGFTYAGHNVNAADKYTWLNNTVTGLADWMLSKSELATGYVTGWTGSAANNEFHVGHATDTTAMSIAAAQANSSTGDTINVGSGSFAEAVTVADARNFVFDGSTITSYTQNVVSAIGGTVTAAGGFALNALTTLVSDTVLNGDVTAVSIDGTASGNRSLTVNGGAVALNGSSYKGSALTFGGTGITLNQAVTTFDTSSVGGDITFTGPIFGTADGAQSVVFNAGPGTGPTNGDISMQNAGTDALWLGSMTASGHDLTGATIYVGGDYSATLTGDQTFTTDTLHTRGGATSSVGGNATGPINAGGTVNVNAGGDFSGNVNAPTTTVTASNVNGTFTGNSATLNGGSNVNATTNVTNLTVNAPSGTVTGTFNTIDTSGSGPLDVNGQTRTGNVGTNPNQIVVEGFTLPEGAFVTASGEIVLPGGMLIGLVSPAAGEGAAGGKPKVTIVHSVQMLGQLLAEGYVAIVVDLATTDDEEEIALN